MTQPQILAQAINLQPAFQDILSNSSPFEIKGILNSELLFFSAVCHGYGVKRILESGRARGQSTEILGRWCQQQGWRMASVEYDADSPDVQVCAQRLQDLQDTVELHFGDAFEKLLPLLTDDSTAVIIDGPKGLQALLLAQECLRNPAVKCVAVHDLHADDRETRGILARVGIPFVSSEDPAFVAQFQDLDAPCWAEHQKYPAFAGWGPYQRKGRKMQSYGPTLLVFADLNIAQLDALKAELEHAIAKFEQQHRLRNTVKTILPQPVLQSLRRIKQCLKRA